MPLVTLIIPVYNAARYLRRCLDSVLEQDFADMEVLVLNDGSRDRSLEISREYEKKDSRIRVVDKENTGVSDTRNRGMQLAEGKYLQFMDSDDWLTPDATSSLVQAAEEDDCDLVIADFYRVNGAHYAEKKHIRTTHVMGREEFALEMADDPSDYYYGVMWNKLYRRSVVEEHGLACDTSLNWCEDFLFNLRFIRYGDRFRAIQKPIYYYMKRRGSLVSTESISVDAVKLRFELLERYKDLYQSMGLYEEHKLKINSYIVSVAKDGTVGIISPNKQKLDPEDVIPEGYRSGYQHVEHTFDPVYDRDSEILILGTFPSVKSREQNFYYGHPQNRFWKVMARLTGEPVPDTVEQKKEMLLKHHIAVWDVVQSCDIIGSSDSSIRNVVPADLGRILSDSRVAKIFANGDKAYKLYQKYCRKETGIPAVKLPSTSPANAIFTLDRLTDTWEELIYGKEEKKMAFEKAKEYLKQFGLENRILVFDTSSATVDLAAQAVGCEPARIAKTLSFKVGDDCVLIVAAGDARIDNSKYKAQFHTKAKMLAPEEVEILVGHAIGGVCPFGVKEGVKVYLDVSLRRFESVYPACGSSNSAVELTLSELETASGSEGWIDVCK